MDNRLLLTFLFVMLSWTCTRAQTTVAVTEESGYDDPMVTEDPVLELTLATDDPTYDLSAASTAGPTTTTAASTAGPTTTTAAPATGATTTTAAPATGATTTTAAPATGATTTTAAPATGATTTTAAPATGATTTTAAPATGATTTTAAPATGATTTTAAPATGATTTTAAPATTPKTNTTVTILETTISSDTCGTESLCGAQPADCNPGNSGNCLFLGAKKKEGNNYEFEMSGESDGYVACTFSPDGDFGNNETTYICANHNGKVKFFTARYNKNKMVKTELPANSVKGKITQNKIQCSFLAALPLGALRAEDNVAMSLSTGDYDAASGDLGTPAFKYQSPVVNLANPNSTVPNVITTTAAPTNAPTAAPTTSHAVPFHKSVLQALLIILSTMTVFLV